jgi:hypothetical protein
MISYGLSFKYISLDVPDKTSRKDLYEVEAISLTSISVESVDGVSGR